MTAGKMFGFIDGPSPFDTLEELERALKEYEALPENMLLRDETIEHTKELIAMRRKESQKG